MPTGTQGSAATVVVKANGSAAGGEVDSGTVRYSGTMAGPAAGEAGSTFRELPAGGGLSALGCVPPVVRHTASHMCCPAYASCNHCAAACLALQFLCVAVVVVVHAAWSCTWQGH